MNHYEVTIHFDKPPTFSTKVRARRIQAAKDEAKRLAKESGYTQRIKKTTAKKLERP